MRKILLFALLCTSVQAMKKQNLCPKLILHSSKKYLTLGSIVSKINFYLLGEKFHLVINQMRVYSKGEYQKGFTDQTLLDASGKKLTCHVIMEPHCNH